ncbi:glycosyltransferase family 2 protein [Winogradskyella sp. A3E31]|uniref:glycosyltransferase family 2 protein n=1 Tax=Winogradskyella sp. A3E31 TaxID=3349637 RepID=UPI00398A6E0C
MSPFFSVVIPLYNKEDYIYNTLNSAINQSYKDFEIIIINDGSTDGSLEKIKLIKHPSFKIYTTENKGVAAARNYGISQSRGTYIALLDADDIWHNNHLDELQKTISKFPEGDLFSNNYEIDFGNNFIKPARFSVPIKTKPFIVDDFFKANRKNSIVWTSSACFSKSSFNQIGGYNEDLKTAQDLDLWIRYALKYKIVFNPKITMTYSFYDRNSLSRTDLNSIRYNFIENFKDQEKNNSSLKEYLDINRYAVALRCKLNNENELYQTLKKDIDPSNLNRLQNMILKLPKPVLKLLKKTHYFLIQNHLYFTAFK